MVMIIPSPETIYFRRPISRSENVTAVDREAVLPTLATRDEWRLRMEAILYT
jgi:hypothetical protein